MERKKHRIRRTIAIILLVIIALIAAFCIIRLVGKYINGTTPNDGINESMCVDL